MKRFVINAKCRPTLRVGELFHRRFAEAAYNLK